LGLDETAASYLNSIDAALRLIGVGLENFGMALRFRPTSMRSTTQTVNGSITARLAADTLRAVVVNWRRRFSPGHA
jgi:hypothetical protein